MAIAHADIAKIMNKVRAPYSISKIASQIGEDLFSLFFYLFNLSKL